MQLPTTSSLFRILVLLAPFSGCSKDAAPPAPKATATEPAVATGRKPCDYVKRADAEKAVGLPLPTTNENLTTNECDYQTAELYGSSVTVGQWEGGCDTAVKSEGNGHQQKVAGLGDEAFFTREHLIIRKGTRCLAVSINGPIPDAEKDDGLERVKTLALTIVSML